ncbi:MAG: DUF1670 domain-containing protein [Thermodesulfovibrionales bacterium]|nr:DUF1670 domain-containing protein [Thermodesulfovibrionales bacterium]
MGIITYYVRDGKNTLRGIKLTLCCKEDLEYLKSSGVSMLRKLRIRRLLQEAMAQGVRLSYRDLSLLLLASKATIKRDLKEYGLRKD